jgi:hypothetical protein
MDAILEDLNFFGGRGDYERVNKILAEEEAASMAFLFTGHPLNCKGKSIH